MADWPLPRALVFDWDNTLVDTRPILHAAMNRLLRRFGREEWSEERARVEMQRSLRDSFPALFGDDWEQARAGWYEAYAAEAGRVAPMPGAAVLLDAAQGLGLHLAVVSNKRGDLLRQEAAALGWMARFAALVGSLDAPFDKPHCAPVDMALARLDGHAAARDAGQLWFVGDTDIDMECAVASGCRAIFMGPAAENHSPAADRIVPDCNDLAQWLVQLGAATS